MKKSIQYRFRKIDVAQFAIFPEHYSSEMSEVGFGLDSQFAFDKEQNVLCSRIIVSMTNEANNLLLKIELCCYFEIAKESMQNILQDNSYVFQPALLVQFASLCYGTLRGVIHMKTIDTPLNGYILPPVFFDTIINNPFIVERQ